MAATRRTLRPSPPPARAPGCRARRAACGSCARPTEQREGEPRGHREVHKQPRHGATQDEFQDHGAPLPKLPPPSTRSGGGSGTRGFTRRQAYATGSTAGSSAAFGLNDEAKRPLWRDSDCNLIACSSCAQRERASPARGSSAPGRRSPRTPLYCPLARGRGRAGVGRLCWSRRHRLGLIALAAMVRAAL
jgi:hypothetical protein